MQQRELVTRAIEGGDDAYTSMVDASVDRVSAVACLILRAPDRARDAVQEALRDPDAWMPGSIA
jgi:hypothetical protein